MNLTLSLCLWIVSAALFGQQREFGWLIGTWQESDQSIEAWTDEGSFLSGSSCKIDKAGNKTVTEEIKLIRKGNDFFYVPDVAGPQGPVEFRITNFNDNSFTAENPAHDFPQKITYRKTGKKLEAAISGRGKSIHYAFTKIK